jgi:transposase InsO family protein
MLNMPTGQTKQGKIPRFIGPLPISKDAWQVISMDFIKDLPRSRVANCILVVVNKSSKYNHFIRLLHPFTSTTVAQAFMSNVYKLHVLPLTIICDRDRVFTSNFWQKLFKLANVKLQMSSAYHPQSDGQTERVNQYLETFFRCFVHTYPKK